MKPRGSVEVVSDENKDINVRDEVFQVSELVEPYRVATSIDIEENLFFCIFDDSLVVIDVKELNVILSSSGQVHVDEDDNDDIHIEDYDGADDNSIDEEEEENSD
jgi:hypothetical protein